METYIFSNIIDIDDLTDNEQLKRIDLKNVHILVDVYGNEVFVTTDDDGYLRSLFADNFRTAAFILNILLNDHEVKIVDMEAFSRDPKQFTENISFEDFRIFSSNSHAISESLADRLSKIEWNDYYNNNKIKSMK